MSIFYFCLFAIVLVVTILFILDKKFFQEGYRPVQCSNYDRIAVDLSALVLHAYVQVSQGKPIDFRKKVVEQWLFVHPPKKQELVKNWDFYPFFGETGWKKWVSRFFYQRSMLGFVGINKHEKLISIVFRNSRRGSDWVTNFGLAFEKNDNFAYRGYLHSGYISVFKSCLAEIEGLLQSFCTREDIKDYDLLLTGHSLGGALSILMATYLADREEYSSLFPSKKIKLITFGSPYVGTKCAHHNFATWLKKHVGYLKCFERATDMAPTVLHFLKVHSQESPSCDDKKKEFIEPIPPVKPTKLLCLRTSRLNLLGSHRIDSYRKAIYYELGIKL